MRENEGHPYVDLFPQMKESQDTLNQIWSYLDIIIHSTDSAFTLLITATTEEEETEDAVLPIHPQFTQRLRRQEKTAEYCSYHMGRVRRLWLIDTKTHLIFNMPHGRSQRTSETSGFISRWDQEERVEVSHHHLQVTVSAHPIHRSETYSIKIQWTGLPEQTLH